MVSSGISRKSGTNARSLSEKRGALPLESIGPGAGKVALPFARASKAAAGPLFEIA